MPMKERSAALSKVGETCRGRFIAPIADLSAKGWLKNAQLALLTIGLLQQ